MRPTFHYSLDLTNNWTSRYANAKGWGGIEAGLFYSTESGLDDLVQLCHEARPPKAPPPVNVNRIAFKSIDDVRRILAPHVASLAVASSLRAQAPAFVPRAMKQQETPQKEILRKRTQASTTQDKEQEETVTEQVLDRPDADTADIVDSTKLVDSMANTVAEAPHVIIPEEQLKVASKLVKRYQHRTTQRELEKKKSVIDSQLGITFETCLKLSTEMQWPNGNYYKKLYLGLVPHLLVCVNTVQAYAQTSKKKAKRRLQKEVKQDLDDLNKKMTELKYVVLCDCNNQLLTIFS